MTSPQHILITGASSGIGTALVLAYAKPGIRLSLHGRSQERLTDIAEKARLMGAFVTLQAGDIRDKSHLAEWIKFCDGIHPLDLVIANAGISAGTSGASETIDQINAIFSTNIDGVMNTISPALSLLLERGKGQIAIISSLASFRGFAGSAAYCASKAAVRIYGEALRSQCLPFGIKVNVVCPGYIKTPMTDINRFRMPFLMSAERAADHILRGLHNDKPRIVFPFVMYALLRLMNSLPQSWLDKPLSFLPKKG